MAPKIVLGKYGHWWHRKALTLSGPSLRAHKHCIGVSGQGKSFLLASYLVQLREQGVAFSLIDPHGDLANQVLALLNDRGLRDERLLYVHLGDPRRALPFNYLKQPYPDHDIAEDVVEVCKRVWPSLAEGAPLFETLCWNGTMILIQNNLPLPELSRVLELKDYRDRLLANVSDSRVIEFFHNNFDRLSEKDRFQEIQSTIRRVNILVRSPALRYTLGQTENRLNFRQIIDQGVSVIYNLSGLKEDPQAFLGALLMRGYESAAMSRADIPEDDRRHHELVTDEFHTFSSKSGKSVETMLSQTRKMGLFAVLAHQNWSQTNDSIRGAIQNCGVKIAFGLDYEDAALSSRILGRVDTKTVSRRDPEGSESEGMAEQWQELVQEIQDLPIGEALVRKRIPKLKKPWRWFIHRPPSKLYRIETIHVPRPKTSPERLEEIKQHYAHLLTRSVEDVKAIIEAPVWKLTIDNEPPPSSIDR